MADSPPTFLETSEEHQSLEAQTYVPSTLVGGAYEEALREDLGSSWLQLGFEIPTEEGVLRELPSEIPTRTPPFNNIRFTNRYAASFIGGAVLNRAADVESLATMGEIRVDETANRVGALLARVRWFPQLSLFFLFLFFSLRFPTSLRKSPHMFCTSPAPVPLRPKPGPFLMRSGEQPMNLTYLP